jgi:para-nitrobenzyl esterase
MNHLRLIVLGQLFALAFVPAAVPAAECPSPSEPDVVCTESGAIRGVREGNTLAFKGIPYAKSPIGALRWRPPEDGVRWEGTRNATDFGAICPQIVSGQVVGSEDCLTLDVWRPREPSATPLPVMVWLTGGRR